MHTYAVLVCRNQQLSGEDQMTIAKRLDGELQSVDNKIKRIGAQSNWRPCRVGSLGALIDRFADRYTHQDTSRQYRAELLALFKPAGVTEPRLLDEASQLVGGGVEE